MCPENLSWFQSQLDLLQSHAHAQHIDISLYVTQAATQDSSSSQYSHSLNDSSPSSPTSPTDGEKPTASFPPPMTEKDLETTVMETHHKETHDTTTTRTRGGGREVKQGRPDVAALIRTAVESTPANQRVLVAACGPAGLMRTVRDTSAAGIRGAGAGVEVHLEEFGW